MATYLTLGPILFTEFEAPQAMPFPVRLETSVRLLPGGGKRIHVIADDDEPIEWSGRFRGPSAEVRARELHYLAKQKKSLDLKWSTLRYKVLIERFEPRFERPNEVPYAIRCIVLVDQANPLLDAYFALDTAIGTDINNALQIGLALGIPGIDTAVAGVASASASIATFVGAAAGPVTALQDAVGLAQSVTGSQISSLGSLTASFSGFGGVVAGGSAASMATSLQSAASSFSSLPGLMNLQASLGRVQSNLSSLF